MKLASNNLKKQINSKIKNMDIDLKYEKKKLEINSDKIVVSINEIKNNPIFKELFINLSDKKMWVKIYSHFFILNCIL
ncbi:MAG: hypothetical protein SPLM_06890 [Spiroplasma phoeniceum]|uniref:hypothetical protein n=2 Tax=Spiroplasma TaxID=2132 RepID=UPI00329553A3